MNRTLTVAACLLTFACASELAAQRHSIYVNGRLRNAATDVQIAQALSRSVDRYRQLTTQVDFLPNDARTAAFAYLQFTIDKETVSSIVSMVMTSKVRASAAKERPILSECSACGPQPVRKLFHEVIEQTLFSGTHALYKPLSIRSCRSAGGDSVEITVARAANGIGLEHGIHYGLRRAPAANETGLILLRDQTATDELTSTFRISVGASRLRSAFVGACRNGTAQVYQLVPHGRLPPDPTKVNRDAPSSGS